MVNEKKEKVKRIGFMERRKGKKKMEN